MNKEPEVARLSEIRDNQCDTIIDRFRQLMSEERINDAMALADEWFEWLHPDMADKEQTVYSHESELRRAYLKLTEG